MRVRSSANMIFSESRFWLFQITFYLCGENGAGLRKMLS
jgi:hypothetical protein